jgi:hypothetical protein
MRVFSIIAAVLAVASSSLAQSTPPEDPAILVRETVYNELHDHQGHGYFRYWIQRRTPTDTRVEEQIETQDGPITRLIVSNGHPLDDRARQNEDARLRELLASPSRQASLREAYQQDERRIGRILALLPDAFAYQDAGLDNGDRHLRFSPNPDYTAHTIEARFFHTLSGDLWIDARMKRLRRLEGRMGDNLDIGFGLLGRVNKGGWFLLVRTQVSPTDWKTQQLQMHISGKLLMFKTLVRETNETRGGFEPVPSGLSLTQGLRVLNESLAAHEAEATGFIRPALLDRDGRHSK